ncbi:uncharacterized protein LOC114295480 [Camellia sinensis]|uniref:uncharacterized protein LOC114295480 n=1 Tax=Camellia sinensis TaxID=4442 RepID=UPI001036065F|nr:uncharacterized protein LOC114295480 [Camellia sinensis]
MPGYSCCGLQSEEDLEIMVGLALSCDIHRIDVFVQCCSLGEGYMICDVEASSSSSVEWDKGLLKELLNFEMRCQIKHARMTSSMIGGLISSDIRVEKARGLVFGDYSSSFDDLRWYVDAANDCNLRSVFYMEFDVDSKGRHFECLFFAFEACIHGFKYCRPVLMLDGTFSKGRHKGCLLAATAKDGNQGLYLLCFAIIDSESYDSWPWFLSKLSVILTPERDITFVADRHGGLLKALAEGRCGHSVENLLEDLSNECWYNAYFQGKRYGEMCTNAAESFNSWIRDERHLFSTSLVDAIRVKLMEQFSRRREVGNKWNRIVCPFAKKKLEETFNDTKAWIVKKCSDDIYEIQLDHSVMRSGKDLNYFLDDYYHVSSYYDSYSHSIYPVPSMWKPNVVVDDDVVLPPLCKRPAGRPRTERIPSKGEIKRIRCNRCGKMGTHNRKTCKEALL